MRRCFGLVRETKTKNKVQSPAKDENPNVPLDLVIEILNRLPAKSVGRFQLVSKSWAKIISSKGFIRSFPFRSLTQPWRLLIFFEKRDHQTGQLNCYFFSSSSSTSTSTSFLSRIIYSVPNPSIEYHTYYVNGLMIIGEIICNPCTGKSIPLPRLEIDRSRLVRRFFGYDPVNDEYKVLYMTQKVNAWSDFKVFTLGAKQESWRPIDCGVPHCPRSKGLCIDGAVYYIANTGTRMNQLSLVRFDLKSEKFDIFARVSDDIQVLNPLGTLTLINYHGKVATPIQPLKCVNTIDLRVFEAGKQDFLETSFHNLPEPVLKMKGIINHTGEIIFAPYCSKEANFIRYDLKGASFKKMKIEVDANVKYFIETDYSVDYVESLMLL